MYPREEVVPPGCVWLEGDNKMNSTDSRTYGPVPIALLQGRVFMQIWHKFRRINHTSWEPDPQARKAEARRWKQNPRLMTLLGDEIPPLEEEAEEKDVAAEANEGEQGVTKQERKTDLEVERQTNAENEPQEEQDVPTGDFVVVENEHADTGSRK